MKTPIQHLADWLAESEGRTATIDVTADAGEAAFRVALKLTFLAWTPHTIGRGATLDDAILKAMENV